MLVIDDLLTVTTSSTILENYLSNNFEEVYDFINHTKHTTLLESRAKIKRYIELNKVIILGLDISNKTNLSFISLLLDMSERLGLIASFRFLYDHLHGKKYNIGSRLKAASQYLIGINTADDYLNRYDSIYGLLQISFETEEDNSDKVLMTLVNYYAEVIHNFGNFHIDAVKTLKAKIEKSKGDSEFSFLNNSLIDNILRVDLSSFSLAYQTIHSLLDTFLGRDIPTRSFKKDFLLEKETDYVKMLQNVPSNFGAIRNISVNQYRLIADDSIFRSLQRGVKVIEDQNQLYAYMNSYGNMHFNKLESSFSSLPKDLFGKEISVIDWACGQGIGTMSFFDYISRNNHKQSINSVSLIEPSDIALKRASLHVMKLSPDTSIMTINRDLDSLSINDFKNKKANIKLHIFSNILDIDSFSLTNLIKLIKGTFEGENYFVCVSPYINDTKTSRIDSFMKSFSNNNDFKKFMTIDNGVGEWTGTNWTRVIRVFKATL